MESHRNNWSSITAVIAGLMAVIVSYSGPLAIFFQAAGEANISPAMMSSWIWAISVGAGLSSILLSWWYRIPVVTAWSAPGTVLLVSLFPELSINEAVAAYITAALVILVVGISGLFNKLVAYIPGGVAAAMIAGILFDFALDAFRTFEVIPMVAALMVLAYVVLKRFSGSFYLVFLFIVGIALSAGFLDTGFSNVRLEFATPQFITPEWSWPGMFGLALPLVIVSLTGQFLPGFAILRTAGYGFSSRSILGVSALVSLPMAFFGGITTVLAALTASLCTGKDAHPLPEKRYIAGISNGVFYLLGGTVSGSIIMLFQAFPDEMVALIAGLALLGAINNSLQAALKDRDVQDAALITFITTASGIQMLGIGSAFWGVVLGCAVHALSKRKQAAPV